jgi:hypothetical protein
MEFCEVCGQARATQAHHRTYRYGILCPPQYLVAICRSCHEAVHGISSGSDILGRLAVRGYRLTRAHRNPSGCAAAFAKAMISLLALLVAVALFTGQSARPDIRNAGATNGPGRVFTLWASQ